MADVQKYLADAASWETQIYQAEKRALQTWRLISFGLLGVVLLLSAALALMMPLKEFSPYVIAVDKETGKTTAAYLAQSGPISQDEAVVKSLIAQYLIQRETYDLYDGQQRYNHVVEMSIDQALVSYQELWKSENPDYPFAKWGRDTKISIEVTAISMLNSQTASVQYSKEYSNAGKNFKKTDHVAIVAFTFVKRKSGLSSIIRNPLGFVVKSWRSDEVQKGTN